MAKRRRKQLAARLRGGDGVNLSYQKKPFNDPGSGIGSSGGFFDPYSGAGGDGDKSSSGWFEPTALISKNWLEVAYIESWVVRKFIDIPVDDMFYKGREWENGNDEFLKKLKEQDEAFGVTDKLINVIKMARLFGTGLMVILDDKSDPKDAIDPENFQADSLASILLFDRFDSEVVYMDTNHLSKTYMQPLMYRFNLAGSVYPDNSAHTYQNQFSTQLECHASRVIRFDGSRPLGTSAWITSSYGNYWGVPELLYAIDDIVHDAKIMSSISHLSVEASIPVIKVEGFKEMLQGKGGGPDEPTLAQLAQIIGMNKSIYKTTFMDANDEFDRVNVSFSGLPDILEKVAMRLAAIAGIPATRFLSKSPSGLNSTGDGDMQNYAIHVQAMQNRMLTNTIKTLDKILARNIGYSELPEFSWVNLADISQKTKSEIMKDYSASLVSLINAGVLDENEARKKLVDEQIFENLEPLPDSLLVERGEELDLNKKDPNEGKSGEMSKDS